jgi:LysM repeat protein
MEFLAMAKTKAARKIARLLVGASLLVVIGAGFSAVGNATDHKVSIGTSGYVKVIVAPGETLWSLALLAAGNGSVSQIVDQIVSANGLNSSDIHAGQKLWVPAN